MLRLILGAQTPEEAVVEVHGWVSGKEVALLEEEGERWLQESARLVLELEGTQFIDGTGLALLDRWAQQGLSLRGGSAFVRQLLARHGLFVTDHAE